LQGENISQPVTNEKVKIRETNPDNYSSENKLTAEDIIETPEIIEPVSVSNSVREKYKKSGLNEQDLEMIHNRLTELMQSEKLYTDPEITLGDVAQKLNIHPNYLSQVINTILNKNFYDYINSQRVEEFKSVVKDPKNQHYTLLSLAFGCGFNSKSSFNRNFRKVTGLSPSHYLLQIHVSLDEVE
jgi:AraC-like DNA-binding protein